MSEKFSVYQVVTDTIMAELDKGIVPWQRGWVSDRNRHRSVHGRDYRGINTLLLELRAMSKGYTSRTWITPNQLFKAGGSIKSTLTEKDDRATTLVVFWKILQDKSDPDKKVPLLRYYRVLNFDQVEGIEEPKRRDDIEPEEFDPVDEAEAIVEGYDGPAITYRGNRAAYRPSTDIVFMPTREQFKGADPFYGTLFHELVHSTGHSSRLNRDEITRLEDTVKLSRDVEAYSREELVAEMGAAMLLAQAGIEPDYQNTAAYIGGWKRKLKDDPKLLVAAAARAQKAADHILGIEYVAEAPTEPAAVAA